MYCTTCGAKLGNASKFCRQCGATLTPTNAPVSDRGNERSDPVSSTGTKPRDPAGQGRPERPIYLFAVAILVVVVLAGGIAAYALPPSGERSLQYQPVTLHPTIDQLRRELVGQWHSQTPDSGLSIDMELFKDGTLVAYNGFGGKYSVLDDGRLKLEVMTFVLTFSYSLTGDTLTLTDSTGIKTIYVRKKP